jgi:hypothetical protein
VQVTEHLMSLLLCLMADDVVVQVTEHLMSLLLNGKYSFPDDNFLLWRKKKKTKFTVSSRIEIIREMKVRRRKTRIFYAASRTFRRAVNLRHIRILRQKHNTESVVINDFCPKTGA